MLNTPTKSDADAVINYLRGDRTLEGSTYRTRGHVLGDIVSAEPVFVAGAIATYADAGYNAFATTSPRARKPSTRAPTTACCMSSTPAPVTRCGRTCRTSSYPRLNALTDPLYSHQFTVDGTPTVGDIDFNRTASLSGGPNWHTILVGGLAAGGPGFYALKITDPSATSESAAATQGDVGVSQRIYAHSRQEQCRVLLRQAGDREDACEGLGCAGDLGLQQHGGRRSRSLVRPRREKRRRYRRHRHHRPHGELLRPLRAGANLRVGKQRRPGRDDRLRLRRGPPGQPVALRPDVDLGQRLERRQARHLHRGGRSGAADHLGSGARRGRRAAHGVRGHRRAHRQQRRRQHPGAVGVRRRRRSVRHPDHRRAAHRTCATRRSPRAAAACATSTRARSTTAPIAAGTSTCPVPASA